MPREQGCLPIEVNPSMELQGKSTNPGGKFVHKWNLHRALDTLFNLFVSDKDQSDQHVIQIAQKIGTMCNAPTGTASLPNCSDNVQICSDSDANCGTFQALVDMVKNTNEAQ